MSSLLNVAAFCHPSLTCSLCFKNLDNNDGDSREKENLYLLPVIIIPLLYSKSILFLSIL